MGADNQTLIRIYLEDSPTLTQLQAANRRRDTRQLAMVARRTP